MWALGTGRFTDGGADRSVSKCIAVSLLLLHSPLANLYWVILYLTHPMGHHHVHPQASAFPPPLPIVLSQRRAKGFMPPHYSQPYANSIFLFLLDRHVLFMYLWAYVWIQHERMCALGLKNSAFSIRMFIVPRLQIDHRSLQTGNLERFNWFINPPKSPYRLIWLNGIGEF